MTNSVLSVRALTVEIPTRRGIVRPVQTVSYDVLPGQIMGVVGESGAGKSMTGNAIMGLLDPPARITQGEVYLQGKRIDGLDGAEMRALRGKHIGMVFQDPLTSLNPLFTVGDQLIETMTEHLSVSDSAARARAIDLLDRVGIPDPSSRVDQYPHQFSGGMRQRVVIALALCSEPEMLIADEPTTALDVSIQAQILDLIKGLARERQVGVILVTHDMGVIAETTDAVTVMYQGRVVESGATEQVLGAPQHPYTQSLIAAVPRGGGLSFGASHSDRFEHPPQGEGSSDAHNGEDRAHFQVLRQRRVQTEDREDQDLREDRDAVADSHVGDGLDQRHEARLLHAGTPSSIGQQLSCKSSERMRGNQWKWYKGNDRIVLFDVAPVLLALFGWAADLLQPARRRSGTGFLSP